jgi:hypothetical protein
MLIHVLWHVAKWDAYKEKFDAVNAACSICKLFY